MFKIVASFYDLAHIVCKDEEISQGQTIKTKKGMYQIIQIHDHDSHTEFLKKIGFEQGFSARRLTPLEIIKSRLE